MRARSHSGRLRLWPFPLEMASVRARSHSERFNSLRLCRASPLVFWAWRWRSCVPARILGARTLRGAVRASPLAFWARGCRSCVPARILGARTLRSAVRAGPLAFWARGCRSCVPACISEVPFASPLAFWAREFSEVPSARARSLYGRRDGFRASPIAFCARLFFSASMCQQSLVSLKSFFPYSILLLQDAKKYLLALGRSGGSPSSTNVMCLDVRGRDRWDWEGTKYHRKNEFPPQGEGGN